MQSRDTSGSCRSVNYITSHTMLCRACNKPERPSNTLLTIKSAVRGTSSTPAYGIGTLWSMLEVNRAILGIHERTDGRTEPHRITCRAKKQYRPLPVVTNIDYVVWASSKSFRICIYVWHLFCSICKHLFSLCLKKQTIKTYFASAKGYAIRSVCYSICLCVVPRKMCMDLHYFLSKIDLGPLRR